MISVGDKFIIEIDKVFEQDGEKLFRAKGFKSLVFDQKGLDKLEMFQKKDKEIKIGDVVKHKDCGNGVVVSLSDSCIYGLTHKGDRFVWLRSNCTKTGKNIDIKSFLDQIEEV